VQRSDDEGHWNVVLDFLHLQHLCSVVEIFRQTIYTALVRNEHLGDTEKQLDDTFIQIFIILRLFCILRTS